MIIYVVDYCYKKEMAQYTMNMYVSMDTCDCHYYFVFIFVGKVNTFMKL